MGNKMQLFKRTAAVLAASLLITVPFIFDHEGESLSSYEDVAGIWTICHGVTGGVIPGMVMTPKECEQLSQSAVGQFLQAVSNDLQIEVSAPFLAAHTSFAYNIGLAGYKRSSALRLANAGQFEASCESMMLWHTAGGKDCRIRANNCYGVIARRQDEIALCLSGITKGQSDAAR